ncbi:2-succinyl-6-hydroxy-2,4-cyclohexadiene-1-carboxylate synthase [Alicyclobacillus cycloheptanicus]|nr:2-succinyl-6-hydroxy-2,4-cyclohexadiene-1-carboxylate synthase [Alicyclobacillus cycloheptanicus]
MLVNGCRYFVRTAGTGPALLLLHGFTGSSRTWEPLMQALSGAFRMVAVDLLGHGQTDAPADAARYSTSETVGDLVTLMQGLGHDRFGVVGYSMGGRIALSLTMMAPVHVTRLFLESASPGLRTDAERADRVARDEALAAYIESAGIEAFVDRWEQTPLFATQASLPEAVRARQRAIRLSQRPRGLANSLRGIGTGAQPSWWGRLDAISAPVLLLTGALDTKFCAIARDMAANIPSALHITVDGAGHTVHLEQPEAYIEQVRQFFQEVEV